MTLFNTPITDNWIPTYEVKILIRNSKGEVIKSKEYSTTDPKDLHDWFIRNSWNKTTNYGKNKRKLADTNEPITT